METLQQPLSLPVILKQVIIFSDRGKRYEVKFEDIMYCVAEGSYTFVHAKGRIFVSSRNLKNFETLLPEWLFYRIHHSHIVNTACITEVVNGRGGSVTMSDGKILEIAARRKMGFLKSFRLKPGTDRNFNLSRTFTFRLGDGAFLI